MRCFENSLLLFDWSKYSSSKVIEVLDVNNKFTFVVNKRINFGHSSLENLAEMKPGHSLHICKTVLKHSLTTGKRSNLLYHSFYAFVINMFQKLKLADYVFPYFSYNGKQLFLVMP